ncbi:MAG TPA: LysR substrate-binding domain-containing protein [Bradyrhizobium sp.]|nr:LysR substrate-binding domain-containing protein [Bradyrhizobium sp.]
MSPSRKTRSAIPTDETGGRAEVYEHTPRIELRQLRYFLAVAEHLNFTRAAEHMGIAQPPLSQHILALERQLQVKLFVRSRRNVALTREGEALVSYARQLSNTTQMAAELMRSIARGEDGPLALGAIFSSIYALIPQIVPPFTRMYPRVKLHLQEMTISQQITALKDFRIDAGLLRGPIADPALEAISLFQEPFVAVVPSNHDLAGEAAITLDQISCYPLIRIHPTANRDFSRRMFGALLDDGYKLDIAQEVSDTHTLIGLVAAGVGVSLVPASLQILQIPQVRYIPLRDLTPVTTLQLVYNKDNPSAVLRNFVRMVEAMAADLGRNVQPKEDSQPARRRRS